MQPFPANAPFPARIASLLPSATLISSAAPEAAPAQPGAYALLLRLEAPLSITLRGTLHHLPAGDYAYAGSARGPGGLRARLARHLRAAKRPHWHIDHLTAVAAHAAALALPGGDECAIRALLSAQPGFTTPIPGFGSSDCAACPAHLLRWVPGRCTRGA